MERKTPLKQRTPLKRGSSYLSSSSPLKSKSTLKRTAPLKVRQVTAKKTQEAYFSIFTGQDMSRCYVTGDASTRALPIDVHHVFPGPYKTASEEHGYVVPLRRDLHDSCHAGDPDGIWEVLKRSCQADFLAHHGSEEDFVAAFGKLTPLPREGNDESES